MFYDIFHNYGFDSETKKESLVESFTHSKWTKVDVKAVRDFDGFWTDYTWYTDGNKHIFMFGDNDFIEPDEYNADWECDSTDEAREWFDSYVGYEDDDLDECTSSFNKEKFFDDGFKKSFSISEIDDNESLEDRGDVVVRLTEDFANFPQWLTDYLTVNGNRNPAKRILVDRGIDLAHATYVKDALPRSNRDPVLRDNTRLSVFRLRDGGYETIYIPGVNNPYIFEYSTYAKSLPIKKILEIATEYGYIDLSNPDNTTRKIRYDRARNVDGVQERGKGQHQVSKNVYAVDSNGYTDYDKILSTETSWVMTKGQDKSGYPLNPEKYVKMLDDVGLDTYAARLESYYKNIESVRARLIALFDKFDVNDSDKYRTQGSFSSSRNVHEDIAEAMTSWSRAIKSYQSVKNSVAKIVSEHETCPSERTDERIKYVFAWEGKYFRDYLKDAVDLISKIENAERLPERD